MMKNQRMFTTNTIDQIIRYEADRTRKDKGIVMAVDHEGKIRSWSEGAELLYGWGIEDVINKSSLQILQSVYPDFERNEVINNMHEKGFWEGGIIQKNRDGIELNVASEIYWCLDKSKKTTISVGILESIDINIKRDKVSSAISINKKNDLPIYSINVIDRNFRFAFASPYLESVTGIAAENYIGKTFADLGMPEKITESHHRILSEVFKTHQEKTIEYSVPVSSVIKDIRTQYIPYFSPDREVIYILTISNEIVSIEQFKGTESEDKKYFHFRQPEKIEKIELSAYVHTKLEIKKCIIEVATNAIDERDLLLLVKFSLGMTKSLLMKFHWKQMRYFSISDFTPEQVAGRCIEDLFIPRGELQCYKLHKYVTGKWQDIYEITPEDIVIGLRQLFSKKLNQNIPELLGEIDPHYKKIQRNILETIRLSGRYALVDRIDGQYITRKSDADSRFSLSEIPSDQLLPQLFKQITPHTRINKIVDAIFSIVTGQAEYRHAMSLANLTLIIREYYSTLWKNDFDEVYDISTEIDSVVFEQFSLRALDNFRKDIITKYVAKGALASDEVEKYLSAAKFMLADFKHGTQNNWYHYFSEQFQGISYEEYLNMYKNRFEYAMKKLRRYFLELYKKELLNK